MHKNDDLQKCTNRYDKKAYNWYNTTMLQCKTCTEKIDLKKCINQKCLKFIRELCKQIKHKNSSKEYQNAYKSIAHTNA